MTATVTHPVSVTCPCGWEGSYATEARAQHALRRHSCERQLRIAARKARGAQQRANVDRTPKPCLHKHANHQHGTNACYVLDGCRCAPCAAARSRQDQQRIRAQAYGRYDKYVDAEASRTHIRHLMDSGMGLKQIVAVSGLSHGTLWKLMYGKTQPDGTRTPTQRVLRTTHQKVMAVQLELADGACVDGNGTRLRLRALVRFGYPMSWLAEQMGTSPSTFSALINSNNDVTVRRRTQATDLFNLHAMTPPATLNIRATSIERSRKHAISKGWVAPLDLDEDLLDQPGYRPHLEPVPVAADDYDEAAVLRRLDGDTTVRLTKADRIEVATRAHQMGWSYQQMVEIAGLTKPERYLPDTAASGRVA